MSKNVKFQSTLPVRGATECLKELKYVLKFQSTLPVRGATMRIIVRTPSMINFNSRSS